MPYTKADVILQVAKELAKDPAALAEIGMGKLAASYKLEYGLAVNLRKNLYTLNCRVRRLLLISTKLLPRKLVSASSGFW